VTDTSVAEPDIPKKKSRLTVQRALTLEAVGRLGNHPAAEEVYFETRRTHPNISKATVYRNLAVLEDKGMVRKLTVPQRADRYDHAPHPHHHILCSGCGRIRDLALPYEKQLDDRAAADSGYREISHETVFMGTCPDCARK
jgi:Fe2+ or Zn2+ uptake regulation protein